MYGSGFDHFGASAGGAASVLTRLLRGSSPASEFVKSIIPLLSSSSLLDSTSTKRSCPVLFMPPNISGVGSRPALLRMARSCAGLPPRPRGAKPPLPRPPGPRPSRLTSSRLLGRGWDCGGAGGKRGAEECCASNVKSPWGGRIGGGGGGGILRSAAPLKVYPAPGGGGGGG